MKATLSLLAAVFLTGGITQAFPFLPDHDLKGPSPASGECTNFAGDYRGACTAEGRVIEDSFKVEQQGCEMIRSRGMDYYIGTLITLTQSIPAHGNEIASGKTTAASYVWSQDKKTLLLTGGTMTQRLNSTDAPSPTPFSGELKLDGNQLTLVARTPGAEGREIANCTYLKK